MKTQKQITIRGYRFSLIFTKIEEKDTERCAYKSGYYERHEPAVFWKGYLKIIDNLYPNRTISKNFTTDTFYRDHVKGLDMKDVLFLSVNHYLFSIGIRDKYVKKVLIDRLAFKLLSDFSFNTYSQESFQFRIPLFDFRPNALDHDLFKIALVTNKSRKLNHGKCCVVWEW